MTEQKKMTVEDVFNIITRATQIKKWPGEYRVASNEHRVFIYCDQIGLPSYYVYTTDGKQHPFSEFESKSLSALIEKRYVNLCQAARQNIEYANKSK